MVRQHRYLRSCFHIVYQQTDVSQGMVFPFAGCTHEDDCFFALVEQEVYRFGLIVRLLVVYLVEDGPEPFLVLR